MRWPQSAAVALERTFDLGWSFVVRVVVVVVSSSRSPLWTSSSSRPRLRRRSPVLNWTLAFLFGRRAKATRFVATRRIHALYPPSRRRRRRVLVAVVVVVVSLISWCRLFDQRIAGTASRCCRNSATAPFISRIIPYLRRRRRCRRRRCLRPRPRRVGVGRSSSSWSSSFVSPARTEFEITSVSSSSPAGDDGGPSLLCAALQNQTRIRRDRSSSAVYRST